MIYQTSGGVPEWSGGEELYIGSAVSAIGKDSESPVLYRDHRMGPGGPPGGATHPGGPRGLKGGGNQPIVGWCTSPWASPLRLGLETLGQGAPHLPWGASTPLAAAPPLGDPSPR